MTIHFESPLKKNQYLCIFSCNAKHYLAFTKGSKFKFAYDRFITHCINRKLFIFRFFVVGEMETCRCQFAFTCLHLLSNCFIEKIVPSPDDDQIQS